jgi:regulatory protein
MDHKITSLKAQKRNKQRVNVFLDGEFAFGLSRIVAAWLQVGQQISDEKIAQLRNADELEVAFQQAVNFLSYRPRSEAEVRKNLHDHAVSEENIVNVLERLHRSGFVDDTHFAQAWVENRNDMRPRGRRALAFELRKKGIADEVIEQTLESLDEESLAYQAAKQRVTRWNHLEWFDFRKKMYAYLTRRGFDYSTALEATSRVWAEDQHRDYPQGEEETL